MKVITLTSEEVQSTQNYIDDITKLCITASTDPKNKAYENYQLNDNSNTLMYKIMHSNELTKDNGVITLLYDGNELIAFSACYINNEWNQVIAGWRSYVHPKYKTRGLVGEYLMPVHMRFASQCGYDRIWITFNSYNKWAYNCYKRIAQGKAVFLGSSTNVHAANAASNNTVVFHDEPKIIKNTEQTVVEIFI